MKGHGSSFLARLLIRGGRLLDPGNNVDEIADVLIEDGRIAAVGLALEARGAEVLDAAGGWARARGCSHGAFARLPLGGNRRR